MKFQALIKTLPILLALSLLTPSGKAIAQTTNIPPPIDPRIPTSALPGESVYDWSMRLGYAAAKEEDYSTALSYFMTALEERPSDRYATIAYWNMMRYLNGDTQISDYERYMNIGYDATGKRDYHTALINFRRALNERP
ncbi:MAG: hypothetical protein ACOC0N_05815, partial [Chroococcales cyanobacterium]